MTCSGVWALIVAAGEGRRFREAFAGGAAPPRKLFVKLDGVPILLRALRAVASCPQIERTVVAAAACDVESVEALIAPERAALRVEKVVVGGRRRQDSVSMALRVVPEDVELVVVHDGARPLVRPEVFGRVIEAACRTGAACAALPCYETLKRVEGAPEEAVIARETLDRSKIWAAQTPQAFRAQTLRELLEEAEHSGIDVTDEAALFDRKGLPVELVPGERTNVKITTPEDLALAEAICGVVQRYEPDMRVGMGFDIHRLVPGRRLILAGEDIPSELGAEGHSDADVAAHAAIDAILGAAALGDIGRLFPDSDPAYAGANSLELLAETRRRLKQAGFEPLSLDVTIFISRPRIAERAEVMAANLARALGLERGRVGVKAKSANGIGPVGEGLAVAAQACALVRATMPRPLK